MSDEIAKIENTLPERLRGKTGSAGRENITTEDITMPRILIAQGLSPQLDEDDPKYIESLKFGQLFNNLTGMNYGSGPISFFILRHGKRAVEWIPRKEGGGIKDRNVPLDDERLQWRGDEPPIATLYHDYLIYLEETRELVMLSMSKTSIKTAKNLNGLIQLRNQDIFEGRYLLSVAKEKNKDGSFGVFVVSNGEWATDEQSAMLKEMFEQFKTATINVVGDEEEEPETGTPDGETPF